MSNTKHLDAHLSGFNGPFYPPCIERLHHAFYAERSSHSRFPNLGSLGRQIPNFVGVGSPNTEDGYDWFFSVCFRTGGKELAILFPHFRDSKMNGGTSADRHIALYMKGEASSSADTESLVKEILAVYQAA